MSKLKQIGTWVLVLLGILVAVKLLGVAFAVLFRSLWLVLRYVVFPVLLFAFAFGVVRNWFKKPPVPPTTP